MSNNVKVINGKEHVIVPKQLYEKYKQDSDILDQVTKKLDSLFKIHS